MKNLKFFLIILLFYINSFALSVSSDDNYKVIKSDKYEIIYTDDYINEVKFIKKNLDQFLKHNSKSFGYSFDEPLRLVLVSDNIQVANGFSTQVPYNLGVYFNGGSGMNDYFATKSWLETLLVHEMVHNYQINAKKSKVSQTLHKYLGNNYMPIFVSIIPLFTLPNLYLPTPILEGNAVINESVYQNGGRLYSGRHNALKNSLIFHNKIDPTTLINDHLNYPYGVEKYIVGGYFMKFLVEKYGLSHVNRFFYLHSDNFLNPFLLNRSFKKHFLRSFHDLVFDFIDYTKKRYKGYKELENVKIINSSKDDIYFSKIGSKIYFITSNLVNKKELNIFDIKTKETIIKNTNLQNGKFFIQDDKYYTASSAFIKPTLYKFGLFDSEKIIKKDTIGKYIQDIYNDKIAYIDIKSSFLETKLFINGNYYATVSSSALFDKDGNIYYFKQNGNIRELYKNKTKIFEYKGYYGKIVDILDDDIYFIANTKNGSGLYKFNGTLYLLNEAENIIDAKIINNNLALCVAATIKGNNVAITPLKPIEYKNIEFDNIKNLQNSFEFQRDFVDEELKPIGYNELKELQFSMLYPTFGSDSDGDFIYGLSGTFIDPVMFNMVNLYRYQMDDLDISGVSYTNERYIPFKINLYDINRDIKYINERGYGGSLEVYGPLLKEGRRVLYFNLKHYMDDKNKNKNPTIASLTYNFEKNFALEDFPYLKSKTQIYLKEDRKEFVYGLKYDINKHLFDEFYFIGSLLTLDSNIDKLENQNGIEVVDNKLKTLEDSTNVLIEGIDFDFYAKDVKKLSLGLSKTLHFSYYGYYNPFSIQKESLFYNYNYFNITSLKNFTINEHIFGIKIDLLMAHRFLLPLTIKYIKNDFSNDDYKIKFLFGAEF